jgi:peptidoglycan L-alanyl-D-glutamate endopeptidase CwlK
LFERIAARYPCVILEGMRSAERQQQLVAEGKSKTLNSKHLVGLAVDAAPLIVGGVDWKDITAFAYFGGYVRGVAEGLGIPIRHGADWDGDFDLRDNKFDDWPHFEIAEG